MGNPKTIFTPWTLFFLVQLAGSLTAVSLNGTYLSSSLFQTAVLLALAGSFLLALVYMAILPSEVEDDE